VTSPGRLGCGAALLVVSALAPGCGYSLAGTGRGTLPEGAHTIYVDTFVNETPRVGLEQRLTEAVLRELSARARLTPVRSRDSADLLLAGRLTSYQAQPVRFDAAGRALEYEISLTAKVTLSDRVTEKAIFENPSFLYRQPYTVPTTTATWVDVENAAVETLARPFARSLVTTLLEGF
jgi:hypothetical protein